jgi:aspartyl protease family protein
MVAVDRVLIILRGFAILAFFATIAWAWAALLLSARLEPVVPAGLFAGTAWISFRGAVTLTTMAVALLAHLRAFWIGLCDNGFAAGRLGVELKANQAWRPRGRQYPCQRPRQPREPTDEFWSWADLKEDIKALFRKLTESIVFQVLVGCSVAVMLVLGVVYYNFRTGGGPPPPVQTEASREVPAAAAQPASIRVFSSRETEGAGERDSAGRYVFNVLVNDVPMAMSYDDDIPLVTIRAEDALRLGISFARLDFATKIKTAKGPIEVAGITISAMTIGKITYRLVPGYVTRPGALRENILGHSFLGRLAAYRVEANRLVLIDRQGQSEVLSSVAKPTQ